MRKGLGVLACLVVLGGCGGGEKTIIEKTVTERAPEQPTRTTPPKGGAASTEGSIRGKIVESEPPGFSEFLTPSGNIGCAISQREVYCEIGDMAWGPPPKPAECSLEWGHQLGIYKNRPAEFICYSGEAARRGAPKLGYGQFIERGPMSCFSRRNGLTCANFSASHGFFLSYQEVSRFP